MSPHKLECLHYIQLTAYSRGSILSWNLFYADFCQFTCSRPEEINEPQDQGFMYGWSFQDMDDHLREVPIWI